jgi:hypothetical protein
MVQPEITEREGRGERGEGRGERGAFLRLKNYNSVKGIEFFIRVTLSSFPQLLGSTRFIVSVPFSPFPQLLGLTITTR